MVALYFEDRRSVLARHPSLAVLWRACPEQRPRRHLLFGPADIQPGSFLSYFPPAMFLRGD